MDQNAAPEIVDLAVILPHPHGWNENFHTVEEETFLNVYKSTKEDKKRLVVQVSDINKELQKKKRELEDTKDDIDAMQGEFRAIQNRANSRRRVHAIREAEQRAREILNRADDNAQAIRDGLQ